MKENSDKYVIFSKSESKAQGEAMFWNNFMGWVSWQDDEGKNNPTIFTEIDTTVFHLPLATTEDAEWITVQEAKRQIAVINADVLFGSNDQQENL